MRQLHCGLPANRRRTAPNGFSYIEVLVATAILAIALIPAMDALQNALRTTAAQNEIAGHGRHLQSLYEEVLAQSFSNLDAAGIAAGSPTTATSYSDVVTANPRRIIYIARYDADNADADDDPFTGVESNVLWVSGEIPNTVHSFKTLTTP